MISAYLLLDCDTMIRVYCDTMIRVYCDMRLFVDDELHRRSDWAQKQLVDASQ